MNGHNAWWRYAPPRSDVFPEGKTEYSIFSFKQMARQKLQPPPPRYLMVAPYLPRFDIYGRHHTCFPPTRQLGQPTPFPPTRAPTRSWLDVAGRQIQLDPCMIKWMQPQKEYGLIVSVTHDTHIWRGSERFRFVPTCDSTWPGLLAANLFKAGLTESNMTKHQLGLGVRL